MSTPEGADPVAANIKNLDVQIDAARAGKLDPAQLFQAVYGFRSLKPEVRQTPLVQGLLHKVGEALQGPVREYALEVLPRYEQEGNQDGIVRSTRVLSLLGRDADPDLADRLANYKREYPQIDQEDEEISPPSRTVSIIERARERHERLRVEQPATESAVDISTRAADIIKKARERYERVSAAQQTPILGDRAAAIVARAQQRASAVQVGPAAEPAPAAASPVSPTTREAEAGEGVREIEVGVDDVMGINLSLVEDRGSLSYFNRNLAIPDIRNILRGLTREQVRDYFRRHPANILNISRNVRLFNSEAHQELVAAENNLSIDQVRSFLNADYLNVLRIPPDRFNSLPKEIQTEVIQAVRNLDPLVLREKLAAGESQLPSVLTLGRDIYILGMVAGLRDSLEELGRVVDKASLGYSPEMLEQVLAINPAQVLRISTYAFEKLVGHRGNHPDAKIWGAIQNALRNVRFKFVTETRPIPQAVEKREPIELERLNSLLDRLEQGITKATEDGIEITRASTPKEQQMQINGVIRFLQEVPTQEDRLAMFQSIIRRPSIIGARIASVLAARERTFGRGRGREQSEAGVYTGYGDILAEFRHELYSLDRVVARAGDANDPFAQLSVPDKLHTLSYFRELEPKAITPDMQAQADRLEAEFIKQLIAERRSWSIEPVYIIDTLSPNGLRIFDQLTQELEDVPHWRDEIVRGLNPERLPPGGVNPADRGGNPLVGEIDRYLDTLQDRLRNRDNIYPILDLIQQLGADEKIIARVVNRLIMADGDDILVRSFMIRAYERLTDDQYEALFKAIPEFSTNSGRRFELPQPFATTPERVQQQAVVTQLREAFEQTQAEPTIDTPAYIEARERYQNLQAQLSEVLGLRGRESFQAAEAAREEAESLSRININHLLSDSIRGQTVEGDSEVLRKLYAEATPEVRKSLEDLLIECARRERENGLLSHDEVIKFEDSLRAAVGAVDYVTLERRHFKVAEAESEFKALLQTRGTEVAIKAFKQRNLLQTGYYLAQAEVSRKIGDYERELASKAGMEIKYVRN